MISKFPQSVVTILELSSNFSSNMSVEIKKSNTGFELSVYVEGISE